MSEQIRVLLSEEELDRKIAELGERISKDYEGESVHLICILKGSSRADQQRLCRQERSPDLYFKGWCIFYL